MVSLWERRGLRDELDRVLREESDVPADLGGLLSSLNSPRVETVEKPSNGLEKLAASRGRESPTSGSMVAELLAAAERSAAIPKSTISKRAIVVRRSACGPSERDSRRTAGMAESEPSRRSRQANRSGVDWPAFQQG